MIPLKIIHMAHRIRPRVPMDLILMDHLQVVIILLHNRHR